MLKWLKKVNLLGLTGLFLLGFCSWGLWALRTKICVLGMWLPVSGLVFVEEFLGIAAMYVVIKKGSKTGMVLYALGGAVGAGVGTYLGIG